MKWKSERNYNGDYEVITGSSLRGVTFASPIGADMVINAHNSDIDALTAERDALARRINTDGAPVDVAALCLEIDEATAERDELQRRLDAVVAMYVPCKEREDDSITQRALNGIMGDLYARALAIAEGREP